MKNHFVGYCCWLACHLFCSVFSQLFGIVAILLLQLKFNLWKERWFSSRKIVSQNHSLQKLTNKKNHEYCLNLLGLLIWEGCQWMLACSMAEDIPWSINAQFMIYREIKKLWKRYRWVLTDPSISVHVMEEYYKKIEK